ncbi:AzlD domain-containing protein [Leptolyngbya sp. FACHB-36]|nr:AzlD domain-containing protein [Leptolyngbya sp. FACHB-36]
MSIPGGKLLLTHTNDRLIGVVANTLFSKRTKNLLLTIVLGMLMLFLGQWLLSPH